MGGASDLPVPSLPQPRIGVANGGSVVQLLGPRAALETPALQHEHVRRMADELARDRDPGRSGADDADVGLEPALVTNPACVPHHGVVSPVLVPALRPVSIIVPTRALPRRRELLRRALESVLSQVEVRAVPVVVINGPDSDPAVVRELRADRRVRVIVLEKAGLSAALRV